MRNAPSKRRCRGFEYKRGVAFIDKEPSPNTPKQWDFGKAEELIKLPALAQEQGSGIMIRWLAAANYNQTG